MFMSGLIGVVLILAIYGGLICIIIYVLRLLARVVCAIERAASSLEIIARNKQDDGKP
jgi:hypothetical protein